MQILMSTYYNLAIFNNISTARLKFLKDWTNFNSLVYFFNCLNHLLYLPWMLIIFFNVLVLTEYDISIWHLCCNGILSFRGSVVLGTKKDIYLKEFFSGNALTDMALIVALFHSSAPVTSFRLIWTFQMLFILSPLNKSIKPSSVQVTSLSTKNIFQKIMWLQWSD